MPPLQVLERIERIRATQRKAEAELAKLVEQAVALGIGWPEIAAWLGVTRQAFRGSVARLGAACRS